MAGLDLASRSQSAPKPESQLVRNKAASSSATPHSRSGTLIGEADEQRARREGVAANHRHRGGRPLKLTPALVDVMVDLIEGGNPPRRAAVLLRVSEATYHRWMKKGAEQRRGKFREFRDRIQAAQAMGEAHLVSIVRESANTDPRLALQMLSRMNREDWAVNPPAKRTDEVPRTPALDRGTITHEHTHEHLYAARGIAADDDDSRLALEALVRRAGARTPLREPGRPRVLPHRGALGAGTPPRASRALARAPRPSGHQATPRPDAPAAREE